MICYNYKSFKYHKLTDLTAAFDHVQIVIDTLSNLRDNNDFNLKKNI